MFSFRNEKNEHIRNKYLLKRFINSEIRMLNAQELFDIISECTKVKELLRWFAIGICVCGVDVNWKQPNSGSNFIHQILKPQFISAIQLLLFNKCSINSQNSEGNTPLHLASLLQDDMITKYLLYQGADLSVKNKRHENVLRFALKKSSASLNILEEFTSKKSTTNNSAKSKKDDKRLSKNEFKKSRNKTCFAETETQSNSSVAQNLTPKLENVKVSSDSWEHCDESVSKSNVTGEAEKAVTAAERMSFRTNLIQGMKGNLNNLDDYLDFETSSRFDSRMFHLESESKLKLKSIFLTSSQENATNSSNRFSVIPQAVLSKVNLIAFYSLLSDPNGPLFQYSSPSSSENVQLFEGRSLVDWMVVFGGIGTREESVLILKALEANFLLQRKDQDFRSIIQRINLQVSSSPVFLFFGM